MALVPILMPQLGESIAEATIVRILRKDGDAVQAVQRCHRSRDEQSRDGGNRPLLRATLGEILAEAGTSHFRGYGARTYRSERGGCQALRSRCGAANDEAAREEARRKARSSCGRRGSDRQGRTAGSRPRRRGTATFPRE